MTTNSTKYSAIHRWERVAAPDFYQREMAVKAAIEAVEEEFEREASLLQGLQVLLETLYREGEFGYTEWCARSKQASRDFYALPFHAKRDAAVEAADSRLRERIAAIRSELGDSADEIIGWPI